MKFISLELSIEEGQTLVKILTERLGKECIHRELLRDEKVQLVKARNSIEQQLQQDMLDEEADSGLEELRTEIALKKRQEGII